MSLGSEEDKNIGYYKGVYGSWFEDPQSVERYLCCN